MDFDEEPDYEYLENMLILIKERYNFSDSFEWDNLNNNNNNLKKQKKRIKKIQRSKNGGSSKSPDILTKINADKDI